MAGFFGFFDYTKPGKGVDKDDLDKSGIALYFDILGRRWSKIIIANILFLIASIPAIVISLYLSAWILMYLLNFSGAQLSSFGVSNLRFFLVAVMLLFTGSGSASAAMSYVLRKYVNDTHAWVWSDFIDNIKHNFLQGTIVYIINTVTFCVLSIAMMYYYYFVGGLMSTFFTTVMVIISVIFLMMQMYVYQIMASVKLKIKDIYRNSFLLTLGRLPVNLAAFAVTVLCVYGLNVLITNPLVLAVVFFVFYSMVVYTQIFITNNTMNKYLIEPSQEYEDSKNKE